jgi:predicted amidohydrolase YtcJ
MATRLTTILVIVIVGATFIAGLIVGAQRDDASGPVDLIIVNGKVYPGGGANLQEAVAVRGNQVLRVGSNREVKRLRRAQTVVLDAHGATVLPGLIDSRVHLLEGALALEQIDLSAVMTIDDLTTELRQYAEDVPAHAWLVGRNGEAPLLAEPNVPPRKILDDAIQNRPVFLTSGDGNLAWANSKALELAGITRRTPNPQSGNVTKDRRTGEPTGVLTDSAVDLVTRVLPQPTTAEQIAALRAAIAEAHRVGITSVQTVTSSDEELRLLNDIRQQGNLAIRVYGSITVPETIAESAVLELDKVRKEYPDDPMLKLGGVEIACTCDPLQLEGAIAVLDKHNWQVMVRTSDGADVRAAYEAMDHAAAANQQPSHDRRHRLDDTLLTDAGARMLFGSNWPSGSLDPLEAIEAAAAGAGELQPAIDAYTTHAAYASYDEQRKGRIAPGMLADIVILSADIFGADSSALKDAVVTVTIFDGKIVYQRPASSSN